MHIQDDQAKNYALTPTMRMSKAVMTKMRAGMEVHNLVFGKSRRCLDMEGAIAVHLFILQVGLELPVQALRIRGHLECVRCGLVVDIHLWHAIRRSGFNHKLDLTGTLHKGIQVRSLVDGPSNSEKAMVAQDHALPFRTKSSRQTLTLLFAEHNAAELCIHRLGVAVEVCDILIDHLERPRKGAPRLARLAMGMTGRVDIRSRLVYR